MGALSNSGRKSANFVGFYKGIQSAGAAVMWSLDSNKLEFMNEFASNWALLSISLVCAAPVVFIKIKDHVFSHLYVSTRFPQHVADTTTVAGLLGDVGFPEKELLELFKSILKLLESCTFPNFVIVPDLYTASRTS
jgi:hypothetical protein